MTAIARAVETLARGGVVAIPTETVYGLAADLENPAAVARIYAIKRRPADHPLIVHLPSAASLTRYARTIPPAAHALATAFWPGPLTLVLDRTALVPDSVTGGQDTVAVRVVDHDLTRAVLTAFGRAVVAPSANRFGAVSPTTAQHVRDDLGTDVDQILDGGPTRVGIESTIIDCTQDPPALLRAGIIDGDMIAAVLGAPLAVATNGAAAIRVPGSLAAHYAPKARVVLADARAIDDIAAEHAQRGERVARLMLPTDPALAALTLYATLRSLSDAHDTIVVTLPPDTSANAAIRDRLQRAAATR